jgi:hypothetical protein
MFKIGEKVVYVRGYCVNMSMIQPNHNDIVHISSCEEDFKGVPHFGILEYPKAKDGLNQYFHVDCLRKLDHTFAEEVTARIEEEINQENLVEA